jgi:hypothetical protein
MRYEIELSYREFQERLIIIEADPAWRADESRTAAPLCP